MRTHPAFTCPCRECKVLDEANRLEDALMDWRLILIGRKRITEDNGAIKARQRHEAVVDHFIQQTVMS